MKDKLNEILRNVMKLLAARDKTLWTGSNWTEGEKTIPGIDDYSVISANVYSYGQDVLMRRSGNAFIGICASSGDTVFNTACLTLTKTGANTYKMETWHIQHAQSGGHSAVVKAEYGVTRIVGVEPVPAKILSGGGAAPKRIFGRFPGLVGRCLA